MAVEQYSLYLHREALPTKVQMDYYYVNATVTAESKFIVFLYSLINIM
jgi:hypothetical protein